jgi:hypothetical protein
MLHPGVFVNRDSEHSLNRKFRDNQMREMLSHFACHFPFLAMLKTINQNHMTRQASFPDTRDDLAKASAAINLTVAGTQADVSADD